jgi:hypothetical protein
MPKLTLEMLQKARALFENSEPEDVGFIDYSGRYYEAVERLRKKEPREIWQQTTGIKLNANPNDD